jgi:hypothetical protein
VLARKLTGRTGLHERAPALESRSCVAPASLLADFLLVFDTNPGICDLLELLVEGNRRPNSFRVTHLRLVGGLNLTTTAV